MEALLIRLLIVVLVLWVGQQVIGAFGLAEPGNRIVQVILLVLCVLWLVFGSTFVPLR